MSTTTWIVLGAALLWSVLSLGIAFFLIKGFVESTWLRIQRAHPGVEPAPDAVRRDFQSFKMGLVNLGLSVHVAVDESHLHLFPAAIIRWAGAGPISAEWSAVEDIGASWLKGWHRVRIEGVLVNGPAWCLRLAGEQGGSS